MSRNNGLRRNYSSCGTSGQPRYDPYMLGGSPGCGVKQLNSRVPAAMSVNTMAYTPAPAPPARTASFNETSVRDCLYWPASLGNQGRSSYSSGMPSYTMNAPSRNVSSGDYQYCAAPPKAYISAPGGKNTPQNIPCQIAPLGTDPMSLIQPLAPLTVRVQAPSDLFSGNPGEPKTISISPNQLYSGR
ncbi:hypothetical protein Ocin01_08462 [Orchesella cincta]|uniref:Uncharacterized protein n=1 Tax=Orchesella cincta TaxID=48709 RepID=A0A1D2MYS9_ORCCI|nr:hypothetical protein Ocin01_08462 [Orchesella cincta]